MGFDFKKSDISDVVLIEPKTYHDNRGFFFENYKESEFFENKINSKFAQDNVSFSKRHVLRGLHYQTKPKEQAKLVSVISGEIFDVAVDIRKDSTTFGKYVSYTLSDKNRNLLYIPEGFAHGFCVISSEAYVHYKVTNEYSSKHTKGILWSDPDLSIKWPTTTPILSDNDKNLPTFSSLKIH